MRIESRATFVFLIVLSFVMPSVMIVSDHGLARVSAPPANAPPELVPLTELFGVAGVALAFTASATDPDGDDLVYTWDFGDGSPLAVGNPVTHAYVLAGMYTFSVNVDDSHGNNVSSSATAWAAFSIRLIWPGWNAFSLPLVGWGYMASTLPLERGDVVADLNSSTQTYRVYTVGISPPFMDFPILPNKGYWVYVDTPRTLDIYGSVPTEKQTIAFKLPVSGGWAIFGFVGLKIHKASEIPAMCDPIGAVVIVALYDPGTMRYFTWTPGAPPYKDISIFPGAGVFIFFRTTASLSYYP